MNISFTGESLEPLGAETINGGTGNDTITSGAGGGTITGGDGVDGITGGSGVDIINFSGISAVANRDTVAAFTLGTDKIQLDVDNTTVGTLAGATTVHEAEAAASDVAGASAYNLNGLITNTTDDYDLITLANTVLANKANANLATGTNGAELLKALGAANNGAVTGLTVDANSKFYLATDDGTNGYLYFVDNGGNALAEAAEIHKIGTFSGCLLDGILPATALMVA